MMRKRRRRFVSKGVYETQRVEHAFMEVETAVALPDGEGVVVFSQSQGVYDDRKQIAKILGLPLEQCARDFGCERWRFWWQGRLERTRDTPRWLPKLMGVPVKVHLTRDESIVMHPKRHPVWMDYELGCDAKKAC
jgi:aldehyde oxidoreductase